jgi:hypothetical protein
VRFVAVALLFVMSVTSCGAGGTYEKRGRKGGDVDRGEVNGRTFDWVSNKPDGDDWTIRVRGSAFWVSYAREESTDKLGSFNLDDKETEKLWDLIDALDLKNRKKGKKDEDEGYVEMMLRNPTGDDEKSIEHEIITVYSPRDTDDEDVIKLANYLIDLIGKYKGEKPHF